MWCLKLFTFCFRKVMQRGPEKLLSGRIFALKPSGWRCCLHRTNTVTIPRFMPCLRLCVSTLPVLMPVWMNICSWWIWNIRTRNQYNTELIRIGSYHFELSTGSGEPPSDYHLQAAISYYHCIAPTYEETQWEQILNLYDLQLDRMYSPALALNRIIAYSKVAGPESALQGTGSV